MFSLRLAPRLERLHVGVEIEARHEAITVEVALGLAGFKRRYERVEVQPCHKPVAVEVRSAAFHEANLVYADI